MEVQLTDFVLCMYNLTAAADPYLLNFNRGLLKTVKVHGAIKFESIILLKI